MAEPRKTVTELREQPHGRVAVELDGAPWRSLPAIAVVRAGLTTGLELDRERLRLLRRELRRSEALARAARALRARDHSAGSLDARLEQAGFAGRERSDALETLGAAGLVDDDRYARLRAAALAERGHGDAAIRWDLTRHGVAEDRADSALAGLAPERERAAALAERRGRTAATARLLARRGFGEDAIEAAVGADPGANGQ